MGAGSRSATCSPLWWEKHGDLPVAVSQLDDDVKQAGRPPGPRSAVSSLPPGELAGTRMAGFVLTRQVPIGKWGKATYALKKTAEDGDHRGHRGHRDSVAKPRRQWLKPPCRV